METPDVRIIFTMDQHYGFTGNVTPETDKQISSIRDIDAINKGDNETVGADDLAVISVTSTDDGTYIIDTSNNDTFAFVDTSTNILNNTVDGIGPAHNKRIGNNYIQLENNSDSFNDNSAKKGHVKTEGTPNNAREKWNKIKKEFINKGVVNDSPKTNVNRPTTHRTTNSRVNNGTHMGPNDVNFKQFVNTIDEIYSMLLKRFAENN